MAAVVPEPAAAHTSEPPISLPSLDYLDRYRNEGTRTYSPHADYTEAEPGYRPTAATRSFDLPVVEMPLDRVNVYTANPPERLSAQYLGDTWALLCIHPQVQTAMPDDVYVRSASKEGVARPPIAVSPSSSTRTLFVQNGEPPHALKVHFPFRVSRYERRMRDEVVQQAIRVSAELEATAHVADGDFAFLREIIGVTHRNLDPHSLRGENWGYLVREMEPHPRAEGKRTLVPGFALYGGDVFDTHAPPLLFQLCGGRDPRAFVLEQIMLPVIRHWAATFMRLGFILEPHGQNVLLEVGPEGRLHRIVHRDLSVGIDMRRRRDAGLDDGELNDYNRMETGEFASIAYDKFMGGHFFARLVSLLQADDRRLRPESLQGPCRDEFARLMPDHRRYLPETVRYFSENRDRFGKPLFLDTGEAPSWRP